MKFIILCLIFISSEQFANDNVKSALKQIKSLGGELKKELKSGLKESPSKALGLCNIKAPIIAKKLNSNEIKVGRVSLKNRNPLNKPKKWMLEEINKYHNKENNDEFVVVKINENKKGLLKPIMTMPMCLKCHGKEIDVNLKNEISQLYPKDKATGYSVGDIRGFFWAEFEEQ